MNRIFVLMIALSSSCIFAQDFTQITSNVAFSAGELFGILKRCNTSPESLANYQESIEKLKSSAFPNDSYGAYSKLFDESYKKGRESVLYKPVMDKAGCQKQIGDANKIFLYYEENT